ncbi:hypothetical protein RCOM_0665370 [Ricinus communis]|uniref:Uncharacterized protein n=1 Tax=Ricinus communis TaxID=3988 RepID=B9SRP3_RICCO|nr:hypothetical protein RCOM_0665370 [Ricinus communis]
MVVGVDDLLCVLLRNTLSLQCTKILELAIYQTANVHYCFLTAEKVESAVQSLREELGEQHVWYGIKCIRSFKPLAEALDEDGFSDMLSSGKRVIFVVKWHFLAYFSCTMIFKAIKMMLNQPRGCHTFSIDGATPRLLETLSLWTDLLEISVYRTLGSKHILRPGSG